MNRRARQIHSANAERIEAERRAMAARWCVTYRAVSEPLFKIAASVGEAEIVAPQPIKRGCLRCEVTFVSTGAGHRMCAACRRLPESIEERSIGAMLR